MTADVAVATATTTPQERASWWSLGAFGGATLYVGVAVGLVLFVILPRLALGWDPAVITSGSMEPLIQPGDVVLTEATGPDGIGPGSVITFRDPSRGGALVTHRVESVAEDGTFTTKGDANAAVDSTPVPPEAVVGRGRLLVPFVGLPLHWILEAQLVNVIIWAMLTLVAVLVAATPPVDAARPATPEPEADDLVIDLTDHDAVIDLTGDEPVIDLTDTTATGATSRRERRAWRLLDRRDRTRRARTADRGGGASSAATAVALIGIVLGAGALTPYAAAAFTGSGTNAGSSFSAGTWSTGPASYLLHAAVHPATDQPASLTQPASRAAVDATALANLSTDLDTAPGRLLVAAGKKWDAPDGSRPTCDAGQPCATATWGLPAATADTTFVGDASLTLYAGRAGFENGNAPTDLQIELLDGATVIATATATVATDSLSAVTATFATDGLTVAAGSTLSIRVTSLGPKALVLGYDATGYEAALTLPTAID